MPTSPTGSARSDDPSSFAALIGAARGGNDAAIAGLYSTYGHLVYGAAYRCLGSESDAEDVLQDVFVGLPHALRSYQEQGSFEAWLKRVTIRTALMKRRAALRRREGDIEDAGHVAGPAIDPADRLAVRAAIAALPQDLRAVFMLKEVEGYSHGEIAELLGITSGASAARLFRAWRLLRVHHTTP